MEAEAGHCVIHPRASDIESKVVGRSGLLFTEDGGRQTPTLSRMKVQDPSHAVCAQPTQHQPDFLCKLITIYRIQSYAPANCRFVDGFLGNSIGQ